MQRESESKKPRWGKPKLIVITRRDGQEAVLATCKSAAGGPGGPSNSYLLCGDFAPGTCGVGCAGFSPS